jgi:hypothetical protein
MGEACTEHNIWHTRYCFAPTYGGEGLSQKKGETCAEHNMWYLKYHFAPTLGGEQGV